MSSYHVPEQPSESGKRSTRCPSCQTLLHFPTSLNRHITCPRPWCKTQFNPWDEPNWPPHHVAPPPRGKDQQFCYRCETLCNFTQGVDYFICPKCRATTIVNHAAYLRKSKLVGAGAVALLLIATALVVLMFVLDLVRLSVLASAVSAVVLAAILVVWAVVLRRQATFQLRQKARLTERVRLLTSPQPLP